MPPLTAVLLGKDSANSRLALDHLLAAGVRVTGVVGPPQSQTGEGGSLAAHAATHGVVGATLSALAGQAPGSVDLVLSYLYRRRIPPAVIALARTACLNFHPAPLPELRGLGGFNVAILEGFDEFGVSAHHVAPAIDEGDLVEVRRFPIDAQNETAASLAARTRPRLLALFRDVVDALVRGDELPRTPQGEGRYVSRDEFERMRTVGPDDPAALVARKARAFWYPPFGGAVVKHGDSEYTVVTPEILNGLPDSRDGS